MTTQNSIYDLRYPDRFIAAQIQFSDNDMPGFPGKAKQVTLYKEVHADKTITWQTETYDFNSSRTEYHGYKEQQEALNGYYATIGRLVADPANNLVVFYSDMEGI